MGEHWLYPVGDPPPDEIDWEKATVHEGRAVQLFISGESCPICGRDDVLFVPFGERFACVDCVTKENGEDG